MSPARIWSFGLVVGVFACAMLLAQDSKDKAGKEAKDTKAKTEKAPTPEEVEKARKDTSYGIGWHLARNELRNGLPIDYVDVEQVLEGFETGLKGEKRKIDSTRYEAAKDVFNAAMATEKERRGPVTKKKGEEFLAKNESAAGVAAFPNGVQYKSAVKGKGKVPKASDWVQAHVVGKLVDGGRLIENTNENGQAMEAPVARLIPGFSFALQNMREGDKWTVWIPYDQAYGEEGSIVVPPFSAIEYEIELIKIIPPPARPAANEDSGEDEGK